MYVRKTDRSSTSSTLPTATPDEVQQVCYTALAITPAAEPHRFQVIELQMSADDKVISATHSTPMEYHLAAQLQKARASYVWTGLSK